MFSLLTVRGIPVILKHATFISFKLVYFCFIACSGGAGFDRLGLKAYSTKFEKLAFRERKFNFLLNIYPWNKKEARRPDFVNVRTQNI